MLALSQEIGTSLRLDQLAVEMDRILYCLVLHGKDFHSQHHLIEEELSQDVVVLATDVFMSREAEIDAIFHHEEALLALVPLEPLK